MNFPDGLFGDLWAYGAILPYALILLWAVWTAPWKRLADSTQMNVWMGTIVVLTLVWSLKAGAKPGLNLHLLGATAFTLMFGRQLAMIGLSLVLAAVTFNASLKGIDGWQPFALNALALTVFPVLVAHAVLSFVERHLPPNIFVYFFVAAFFGGAAAAVATGFLTGTLLWLAGAYTADLLFSDYLPFYILLGFAEAWLNGAAITLMVVYYPRWVGSFDDRRYLWQKKEPRP
ncbi:MAG: energy-coupling factor ABC transporter permease [Rhodocyclaceae bacterium]|nr:energy-coupling factor ABC transporter permease [Rhodocyclaceae bacterium]